MTSHEEQIRRKFRGYSSQRLLIELTKQQENYYDGYGYYNVFEMDVLEKMIKEADEIEKLI